MSQKNAPKFIKPKAIWGRNLIFRDASIDDAAFIVKLRNHQSKSAHISKTSTDLRLQEQWLLNYAKDCEQVYFVILNKNRDRVGTVRLYDRDGDSFCWGSWLLIDGVPSSYAIESALLIYHFALSLGFERAHFDVRKNNQSVWRFHERFGAKKIREIQNDYLYSISRSAIENSLLRYGKYLPNGFVVENY